jgi:hypothetical protein
MKINLILLKLNYTNKFLTILAAYSNYTFKIVFLTFLFNIKKQLNKKFKMYFLIYMFIILKPHPNFLILSK